MSRVSGAPDKFAVAAFDALLANIAILDPQGRIIAVNRAWERFAAENAGPQDHAATPGPAAEEPAVMSGPAASEQALSGLGRNYLAVCEATEGEDRPYAVSIARNIREVLAGRTDGETEYPCMLPDGLHYYLARVSGFEQDGERFAVVAHEDITRRKRAELEVQAFNRTLEARVQERNRQLEDQNAQLHHTRQALQTNNEALAESNLQLAQFAHVASHDLQEPLRIMGAYSDLLRHRYRDGLDARAHVYLNHITEQVTRARQMVSDVLAFSVVSYRPQLDVISLESSWNEALHFVTLPPDVHLSRGELPLVRANPAHMRQLLGNLLGNSLKFRTPRPLELSLTCAGRAPGTPPGMVELILRDNGIGIAPEYRAQVFGMFQRLHSRTDSGGNGIGLAICRKIIEHHGGQIWIEVGDPAANPGEQGVAVHFTLPLPVAP